MTREKSYFTEEESPASGSGSTSSRKKRKLIISVVVTVIIIVVIIAIVVPMVVVTQKAAGSESITSDHWCGLLLPAGMNVSTLVPRLISGRKTCDITGNCWTKEQCYTCFEGPNRDRVGNINDIPVCCPQCTRHGLHIRWDRCDCSNND